MGFYSFSRWLCILFFQNRFYTFISLHMAAIAREWPSSISVELTPPSWLACKIQIPPPVRYNNSCRYSSIKLWCVSFVQNSFYMFISSIYLHVYHMCIYIYIRLTIQLKNCILLMCVYITFSNLMIILLLRNRFYMII